MTVTGDQAAVISRLSIQRLSEYHKALARWFESIRDQLLNGKGFYKDDFGTSFWEEMLYQEDLIRYQRPN